VRTTAGSSCPCELSLWRPRRNVGIHAGMLGPGTSPLWSRSGACVRCLRPRPPLLPGMQDRGPRRRTGTVATRHGEKRRPNRRERRPMRRSRAAGTPARAQRDFSNDRIARSFRARRRGGTSSERRTAASRARSPGLHSGSGASRYGPDQGRGRPANTCPVLSVPSGPRRPTAPATPSPAGRPVR